METSRQVPRTVLLAEHLNLRRGHRTVYEDLTVSFSSGVTAILGPNGAGKTTMLEGILDPRILRQNRISLDDEVVGKNLSESSFYSRVGHMPQEWRYFGGFTALQSVQYAAWLKGIPARSIRAAALRALESVELLDRQNEAVRKLSGGMRQRVGLAEAFVNEPRLVVLDEPTVGLDPAQRHLFRELVKRQSAERAVVISTHLTDDVEAMADRVLVVNEGRLVFDGTTASLARRARTGFSGAGAVEAGYLDVVGTVNASTAA